LSNLENLTAKIKADSETKAKKIIDDAQREAAALKAQSEADANAEARRVLAGAEDEAKKLVELTLSAKKIEIRDKALAAKQGTIERALQAAKEKLTGMDASAYAAFVWKYLSQTTVAAGEVLRIPQQYAAGFDLAALNKKLTEAGKPALTLDTAAHAANGFKLVKEDAENDFSFDALIDFYRVDLEQAVVEMLF